MVNGQKLLYLYSHCSGTFHSAAPQAEQTGKAKTMPLFGAVFRCSVEAFSQDHVSGPFVICIHVLIESTGIFLLWKKHPKSIKRYFLLLTLFPKKHQTIAGIVKKFDQCFQIWMAKFYKNESCLVDRYN